MGVGVRQRTAHVLGFLSRGADDRSKTEDERVNYHYTHAVLLHYLGYIVPWEQFPPWVTERLEPGRAGYLARLERLELLERLETGRAAR